MHLALKTTSVNSVKEAPFVCLKKFGQKFPFLFHFVILDMYVPPGKPYVLRNALVVCGKFSFRPALLTMKRCLHEQAKECGFISHLSELKVSLGWGVEGRWRRRRGGERRGEGRDKVGGGEEEKGRGKKRKMRR